MSTFAKGARRAVEILDFVAQGRAAPSARQIFANLAAPRSSGYELLRGLEQRQFLQKRAGGCWILGDEVHALALSRFGLGRIAAEIVTALSALQEGTQEIAQLSVLNDDKTLITHAFSSLRAMRIHTDVGTEMAVNWTAAGRLLICGLDDSALRRFLRANARPAPTGKALMQTEAFMQEVRVAGARGYAIEIEHAHRDACSIAASVTDHTELCIAAVSLTLPTERMLNSQDTLVSLVRAAAAKLTHALTKPAA